MLPLFLFFEDYRWKGSIKPDDSLRDEKKETIKMERMVISRYFNYKAMKPSNQSMCTFKFTSLRTKRVISIEQLL